jgi:recombinational DNA repair protein (RecF pathway)
MATPSTEPVVCVGCAAVLSEGEWSQFDGRMLCRKCWDKAKDADWRRARDIARKAIEAATKKQ